jgi:hypothetical protein
MSLLPLKLNAKDRISLGGPQKGLKVEYLHNSISLARIKSHFGKFVGNGLPHVSVISR